jgi:hypothetical protein
MADNSELPPTFRIHAKTWEGLWMLSVSNGGVPVRAIDWSGILRQTKAFTYLPKADARRRSVR